MRTILIVFSFQITFLLKISVKNVANLLEKCNFAARYPLEKCNKCMKNPLEKCNYTRI